MTRKTLMAVAAMASLGAVAANTECTWIGGASGSFDTPENWDPTWPTDATGTRIVKDTVACITNSANLTIGGSFCELWVKSGTVVLTHTYRLGGTASSANEVTVRVDAGASLQMSQTNSDFMGGGNTVTFVKDGAGVLKAGFQISHWATTGSMFKTVDVRGGTLEFTNNKVLHTSDKTVFIRSGAKLVGTPASTVIPADYAVTIEEGGVLDLGNPAASKTYRALIGAGVVSNASNKADAPLILLNEGAAVGSKGAFAGKYYGYVKFDPTNNVKITVGSSDMFANATVTLGEGVTNPPFEFAGGIGTFVVSAPSLFAGYTTDVDDEPINFVSSLPAGYVHTAAGDDDWSAFSITAKGDITEKSAGTWTIGSLYLNNATFLVDGKTTGSKFVVKGGTLDNVMLRLYKPNHQFENDGAEIRCKGSVSPETGSSYVQTAGSFTAYPAYAKGVAGEFPYVVSGGTFTSTVQDYYGMGFGLDASGDARVELKNGAKGAHALTWGGYNHTLRVRGNATVKAEDIDFWYYTGDMATGTVALAENGLLEVSGTLGSRDNRTPIDAAGAQIVFDGGTLRSVRDGTVTWPNPATLASGRFPMYVKENGATIDVPRSAVTASLVWAQPVISAAALGNADGGLTKTGCGVLYFKDYVGLSGPLEIAMGGILSSYTPVADKFAFGTGSVILGRAFLDPYLKKNYVLASGEGSALRAKANGLVYLRQLGTAEEPGTALEIGAVGAKTPGIVVDPHAALAFCMPYGSAQAVQGNDFVQNPVKVHGGIALDETGVASDPIFLVNIPQEAPYSRNRGQRLFWFVTCDADGNLAKKLPTHTNEFPATLDTTSYLRVGEDYSGVGIRELTGSRTVGALEVRGSDNGAYIGGLRIKKNEKLTVDGRKGKKAKVLLNGLMTTGQQGCVAHIDGPGTLDFGEAEGFVAVNSTSTSYAGEYVPTIGATVAGSNGVTFFGLATTGYDGSYGKWRNLIALTAHNTYAGGTWAECISLLPKYADSLGTGTVTVKGDALTGGELVFSKDYAGAAFANALSLEGVGRTYGAALWAEKDAEVTGAITLTGDTTVGAAEGATLTIGSTITGAGKLTVVGAGTVVFSGDVSAIGKIAVKDGAKLVFTPTAKVAEGAIEFADGAAVTLPNGYALDLAGKTRTVSGIGGAGSVINGQLVVTGEIQPGGAGAVGTLTFATAPVVNGATLVVEGDRQGGADKMVVVGAFDATGLSVRTAGPWSAFRNAATRIVDSGTVTGFETQVIPHFTVTVSETNNGIDLVRVKNGLMFFAQ